MLFSRARFLLLIALLPSACGFEPMYGARPSTGAASPGVTIAGVVVDASTPEMAHKHMAQQFKNDLEDRMNPEGGSRASPHYRLKAVLGYTENPVAISPDGTVSRYNVALNANLTLFRVADSAPVWKSAVRRTGSYNNVSNAYYSTYVSSQDTIKRTVTSLAEDVQMRLAAFLTQNPNPQPIAEAPPADVREVAPRRGADSPYPVPSPAQPYPVNPPLAR